MPSELFEKKLREKLSQATIPPAPELWINIEDQLKAGGRKRGIGIWILLVLLLLASMGAMWGFWQMNETQQDYTQAAYTQQEPLSEPVLPSLALTENQESLKMNSSLDEGVALAAVSEPEEFSPSQKLSEAKKEEEKHAPNFISSGNQSTEILTSSAPSYRSNNNKQTNTSDSDTYTSAVLSQNLSEDLSSQVPQHTSPALQGSHILSETSSISSHQEIAEVAGLLQQSYFSVSGKLGTQGLSIPLPKQAFRKKWAFLAYMDFHNDLRKVSFPNIATKQDLMAPIIEGFNTDPASDNTNPYAYEGLNTPGNLIVSAPQKSLSFGLQAEWQFHPKFSLQTGLEYGSFSLGSYFVGIINSDVALASPDQRTNNLVSRRSTLFTYHQLGIPIQLNYQLLAKGRSSVNIYGGASLYAARAYSKSILQSANFYEFTEENVRGANSDIFNTNSVSADVPRLLQYNPFNLTVQGGFDYFYHLSDKNSIFFGPQLKFQATPIYREQQAEINEVPLYLGLRIGFRFAR